MTDRHPRLFGVPLAAVTTDEFIDRMAAWAGEEVVGAPRVVTYLNAHTANLAAEDPEFRALLERSALTYADGMAVVRACRRLGTPLPERVNAGDFLERFLWRMKRDDVPVGLLGCGRPVVEACASRLEAAVPGLRFACVESGHFALGGEEERVLLQRIRDSQPAVLLTGMGSPRQERWAFARGAETGARVVWCVGALFEYFSGLRPRAPVWMRQAGLEWAFRLGCEPRRMARRYLWGNGAFLLRLNQERRRQSGSNSRERDCPHQG